MRRRRTELAEGQDSSTRTIADPELLMQQVRSLLAEAQALSARLAALNEVAVAVQASLDTEEVLQAFVREARWVLDYQVCSVAIWEGDVYIERVLRANNAKHAEEKVRSVQGTAIGKSLLLGRALVLDSLEPGDGGPEGMQSALILPLRTAGQVIGTLNFFARPANRYSVDDLRIAYALAVQIAAVFQNARLFSAATRARDELNTVLESISDAVLVVDDSGRIVLINSALQRLLHLAEKPWVGRRATSLARGRGRHGKHVLGASALRAFVETTRTVSTGQFQLTDGKYIEWAVAPFASAEIAGYVLTLRDVSDRVMLEQLRDDMIGMLVHDLRTPLTSLLMGFDLIKLYKHEPHDPAETDAILSQMRSSADRLLYQVNTILDVRKMEARRLELVPVFVDLRMLVQRSLDPLRPLLEQTEQQYSLEFPANLPQVEVDVALIQRVLENLVGNAHKFTPYRGRIRVGARVNNDANIVEVFVRDSGMGVPAELREHIFEKYGQVSSEQSRRGTGIGLYFCKLAIEAHGGAIGVRDAPDTGSIFWFTLPIAHDHHATITPARQADAA